MAIIQTPSIANVVEDQTPQLGGNLDCQDYQLQWSGSSQYIGSTTLGAGLTVSAGSNNLTLTSSGNLSINTNAAERAIFQSAGGLSVGGDVAPLSVDSFYDLGTDSLRWANTYTDTITVGDGVDAVLTADAADTLALRNSTNAQAFNVYNTYTDASNYERLEVKWDTNVAVIGTSSAGTGSGRELQFHINGTERWKISADGSIIPSADSIRSIGTNGTRVLGIYTDQIITRGVKTDVETFTAASDTLDADNNVALCDCTSNAITINLPAAATGQQYHIKKIDATANTVTIDPNGTETIDGSLTKVISTQYDSITVVSDGSNWFIV